MALPLILASLPRSVQSRMRNAVHFWKDQSGHTQYCAARRSQYEAYGGSAENNLVLQTIQPMAMPLRRHMCVGLVGKSFRTLDNMLAFVKSVSFVVAERELVKIKAITRQAMTANDQFYRVFREALRDAGKQ